MTGKLKPSSQQVSTSLVDETVILNHESGMYYSLNTVGTFIWETLQKSPMTVAELSDLVVETFEIDIFTAEKDVTELITKLLNEKLVEMD